MRHNVRSKLLGVTSCVALLAPASLAQAQVAHRGRESTGLTEIVVTAQKRAQRLQDVPIAITAITQATLQANRIQSVTDLSGVAPNVTVRESGGSIGIPAFGIRGIISYGVVPGSDKETSIYIDGVYLGSPEGSNFELPDIQQIEVLRGPQGTLFGRNATAGAISITTRDPTGKLGGRQEFTVGNYDQFRTRTSIDLPSVGPFSAYVSYVHNQRNGDIRNLGAGTVWDRTGPGTTQGVEVSPKTLGAHDGNTYFGAFKYEPNDVFKTVYKFDYATDTYSPDGVAPVAINPAYLGPAGGGYLDLVLAFNPALVLDPTAKRPDAVNNAFSTNGYQKTWGHNITSTLVVNDAITLKNIAAYRFSSIYIADQLDGAGGLTLDNVPAIYGGSPNTPFCILCINSETQNRQISDELQANYSSHWLTLTSGLLYFHQNTVSGAPPGMANDFVLTGFPNGRIPLGAFYPGTDIPNNTGGFATSSNSATSLAAYVQPEFHVTTKLDIVGGVRITDDKKSGAFAFGGDFTPGPGGNYATGTFSGVEYANFHYQQTKPAWTLGLNYKLTHDILLYGKYSDSFVSGGAIGGVSFKPETASSFEVGGKADFLQHRLRTNVSLFDVEYRNLQSAQSGQNVGFPQLGTVIIDQGNANAKGAEFEVTARPIDPVTFNGSLGYTDVYDTAISQAILASYGGYRPTLIPKWTATLAGAWTSEPMWRGARVVARIDADWHSKENVLQDSYLAYPGYLAIRYLPAAWNVNARLSLGDIDIGGHTFEIAGWVKNLTQNRDASYPLGFGGFSASASFLAARTYGMDVSFQF